MLLNEKQEHFNTFLCFGEIIEPVRKTKPFVIAELKIVSELAHFQEFLNIDQDSSVNFFHIKFLSRTMQETTFDHDINKAIAALILSSAIICNKPHEQLKLQYFNSRFIKVENNIFLFSYDTTVNIMIFINALLM